MQQTFGKAVRSARAGLGWSQERLAEMAGLDRSYVGEIERGQVSPSLTVAARLAAALGVPLSSLLRQCEDREVAVTADDRL